MKAFYIETWGVYLGQCVRCMGGWLVIPTGGKAPFWTWGYSNVREELEALWS